MAVKPKPLIASILISLFVLHIVQALDHSSENSSLPATSISNKIDCSSACIARCQLSSRQRLCNRACGTCCSRCNCVPAGTSGNQEQCPCYASLTTHRGRLKCP